MQNLVLVRGVGFSSDNTACLMSAARIFSGEAKLSDPRDDNCSQVCPSVRAIAIKLNDLGCWSSVAERTAELLPLVPMLVGTATSDPDVLRKRAYLCADYAVRAFLPLALTHVGLASEALKLRALSPIIDKETAMAGCEATKRNAVFGSSFAHVCALYATMDIITDATIQAAAGYAASVFSYDQVKSLMIELLKKLCLVK